MTLVSDGISKLLRSWRIGCFEQAWKSLCLRSRDDSEPNACSFAGWRRVFQLASSNPRINDDIETTLQRFLAFCGMVVLFLVGIAAAMAVLFFFVVDGTVVVSRWLSRVGRRLGAAFYMIGMAISDPPSLDREWKMRNSGAFENSDSPCTPSCWQPRQANSWDHDNIYKYSSTTGFMPIPSTRCNYYY